MNKRNSIIGVIVVCIAIGLYGLIAYILQFKQVSFAFASGIDSVTIYKDHEEGAPTEIVTVTKDDTSNKWIQKGGYSISAKGADIDSAVFSVDISDSTSTITVNPGYTEKYLSAIADKNLADVTQKFQTKYPNVMNRYHIQSFRVLKDGTWGVVLITPNDYDDQNPVAPYRGIVKKEGEVYGIHSTPELVFTKYNTTDIPVDILQRVNKLAL